MSYQVKLLPIVLTDLRKAKKWYRLKSKTLAMEFKLELDKEINYIAKNPEHYQLKYKGLRQSLVTRFPYAIYYILEEEKERIVVFAVLHTSRNPEIVMNRQINKLS